MWPVLRCSLTNAAQVSFSLGLRGYTLVILGTNVSFRSMVWSKGWWGGGSWLWVDSAKTLAKSKQKSGRKTSLGFLVWASSVDMVTLLMFSSRGYARKDLSTLEEKSIENLFQSMMGFHFYNQGIPRITWGRERRMTINLTVLEKGPEEKEMTEIQRIVPLVLGVRSTL